MSESADFAREDDTQDFDTGTFLQLGSEPSRIPKELEPEITVVYDVDGWPTSEDMALQILEERRAMAERTDQSLHFLQAIRRAVNYTGI